MRIVAACDPGSKGAVVFGEAGRMKIIDVVKISGREDKHFKELVAANNDWCTKPCLAIIENVAQHRQGFSAGNSVKLGESVGLLCGIFIALDVPILMVNSKDWMWGLFGKENVPSGRENYQKRKRFIRAKMQERFPEQKVIMQTADAFAMLCWYWKREGVGE